MNLKFYLRGLGLGIVITAVLLGITAGGRKETLSDEEITTKARALGMIDASELAEYVEDAKLDTEEKLRDQIEKEVKEELESSLREEIRAELETDLQPPEGSDNGTAEGEEGADGADAGSIASGDGQEIAAAAEPQPEPVKFTVYLGELPKDVCVRLERAGLVESALEFEKFLQGNGYDRSIVAMEYKIPVGADAEKIARIITGQRD